LNPYLLIKSLLISATKWLFFEVVKKIQRNWLFPYANLNHVVSRYYQSERNTTLLFDAILSKVERNLICIADFEAS